MIQAVGFGLAEGGYYFAMSDIMDFEADRRYIHERFMAAFRIDQL